MATEKQKQAARKNIKKAQAARAKKAPAKKSSSSGMSTTARDRLSDAKFAFPDDRKEPLNDAKHVRNAIARFDQVEEFPMPSGSGRGSGSRPPPRSTTSGSRQPVGEN
jgi:hypothetical protein